MHNLIVRCRDKWPAFYGLIFLVFMISFHLPISAKASNNIFYVGLAVPAMVWWLSNPKRALSLFNVAPVFFALFGILALWLGIHEFSFFKESMYVAILFVCCAMLESREGRSQQVFIWFAAINLALLVVAILSWWASSAAGGAEVRLSLWGQAENPVYAALLCISSLVFIWVFLIEERLRGHSLTALWIGLIGLVALAMLCSIVFQARSALLGFVAFLFVYLVQRRLFIWGVLVGVGIAATAVLFGGGEVLLERGLSYRPSIWMDAVRRLFMECNPLMGCGKDGYRFLGEFFHPHSAYFSVLYHGGIVGFVLFVGMAIAFLVSAWRVESRWLLVALVGWGGVTTATGGVISSPRALWVFFWIPTLMALLESGQEVLKRYYSSRYRP